MVHYACMHVVKENRLFTVLHLTLPRTCGQADSEGLEGIFIDSRSRAPYTATLILSYTTQPRSPRQVFIQVGRSRQAAVRWTTLLSPLFKLPRGNVLSAVSRSLINRSC